MKKNYITPALQQVAMVTEGLLAKSGDNQVGVVEDTATDTQWNHKKNDIWSYMEDVEE